jgi:deoxyribonuclease V
MIPDLPLLPDMPSALVGLVCQIPPGTVSTYGGLARALGDAIAARWVGQFLLHLDAGLDCPSHRVIRSTGHLGGYAWGGSEQKARRLADEGVAVSPGGTVDLAKFRFDRFVGDPPLRALRALQQGIPARYSAVNRVRRPRLVGGVDVSYNPARGEGVAALALVDIATGRLIATQTVRDRVRFPYISTYLAFRELPLLVQLWEQVCQSPERPDVLVVDGSGILHPLQAGIATHFGIVVDMPTVGVTKKLLCGRVDLAGMQRGEIRRVMVGRRKRGAAIRPDVKSRRPLFVSAGHLISTNSAIRLVTRLLHRRRLPEPIYWADKISRSEARK